MTRIIARLYPHKIRMGFKQLLLYCSIGVPLETYLSRLALFGFIISFFVSLIISLFSNLNFFLMLFVVFIFSQVVVYSWLTLSADSRARAVEDLLPDLLQLMASNLRAGHTLDRALILAARPEFGNFQEEINRAGKDVATGTDFNESILKMSRRIRSDKLSKAIQLIVAGQKSGGSLVDLLSQSASNLRQQKLIDERVRSNVLVYVIFIFAAIGFGAPVLFSLSSFLISVMKDVFSSVDIPQTTASVDIPINFSEINLDPSFITQYTIISMVITSIMGSMILGLISKGEKKAGLKFMPVLIVLTISLFFIVRMVISTLLGGLFNL
jgi:archaeal flagellar protein FlaJ